MSGVPDPGEGARELHPPEFVNDVTSGQYAGALEELGRFAAIDTDGIAGLDDLNRLLGTTGMSLYVVLKLQGRAAHGGFEFRRPMEEPSHYFFMSNRDGGVYVETYEQSPKGKKERTTRVAKVPMQVMTPRADASKNLDVMYAMDRWSVNAGNYRPLRDLRDRRACRGYGRVVQGLAADLLDLVPEPIRVSDLPPLT